MNGAISASWYGDMLGADKQKEGIGSPNLNAPTSVGWFSAMPDFSITVLEAENGDERINGQDSQLVFEIYNQKWLEDFNVLTMLMRLEADVNGDGVVDLNDVRAIQVIVLENLVR